MGKFTRLLTLVSGLALMTVPALADPVTGILSIEGSDLYSLSLQTITFNPGSGTVGGISTGTLAPFTAGNPVALFDFGWGASFDPGTVVFSSTEDGKTVAYALNSVRAVADGTGLQLNGSGMLSETGFATTPASFTLTSQDGGKDLYDVTFSATTLATPPNTVPVVPEPSSLVLLGSGLSALGLLVMRRSIRA